MKITLKAARVNAGYTQAQAAQALGITKQTLLNYEKNKTSVPMNIAKKMEKLYKMSLDYIEFF